MWMWIILGALIAIVATFLIITGIMDRKRNKRLKLKNQQINALRQDATDLIALWVHIVIEENNHLLSQFVPSIGAFKMQDVKATAKQALMLLTQQEPYLLIKDAPEQANAINQFKKLLHTASNNWTKSALYTVNFFQELAQKAQKIDRYQNFYLQAKQKIRDLYYQINK